jgi:choline dehydrogenase-like flavoprotein
MILDSMQDRGLGLQHDMFTTGDNPHGCGHAPRTVYRGDRTTAANYLVNQGPNLAIKTEMTVDKVILEGEGSNLRAASVQVVEKDGSVRKIEARKEVIISGGAYCSPTILLRSGLGPKAELASHGIDCKVDLPGVGKNLMDHLVNKISCLPTSK